MNQAYNESSTSGEPAPAVLGTQLQPQTDRGWDWYWYSDIPGIVLTQSCTRAGNCYFVLYRHHANQVTNFFLKCNYCRNISASNDLLKCKFESLYALNLIAILSE